MARKSNRRGSRSRTRSIAKRAGYRSGFEYTIAKQAKKEGIKLEYEPDGFIIKYQPKIKKYKPDWVLANGIIVETKGQWTGADRERHLLIREQHPELDIRFVFMADNTLSRRSDTRYTDWCRAHGFLCAVGAIPKEWAEENNKNERD